MSRVDLRAIRLAHREQTSAAWRASLKRRRVITDLARTDHERDRVAEISRQRRVARAVRLLERYMASEQMWGGHKRDIAILEWLITVVQHGTGETR